MAAVLKNLKNRPASTGPWRQQIGHNRAHIRNHSTASHCFRIGNFAAAVISDGHILLEEPHEVFATLPQEKINPALDEANIPRGKMRIAQNCLLLDIGGHLVLFDNGMGTSILFGFEAGRLIKNLAEVAISPLQIDSLVLSHAHSDHCWGTMRDDDTPAFPNAKIYMAEEELRYWEHCNDRELEIDTAGVRHHLLPLLDRILFFEDEEEFLPGIRALLAPGHTPGHSIFLIASAGEYLCVVSDVAFHNPLSFIHPEAKTAYDHDPLLAIETRTGLLGQLADEQMKIIHYHAAWPGIGHVIRDGNAFRYISDQIETHAHLHSSFQTMHRG